MRGVMPHYDRITEPKWSPDPSQSLHNSNTISEPAAVEANPGHLMYSHALHLTQGLSGTLISASNRHKRSHTHTAFTLLFTSMEIHILPLNFPTTTRGSSHMKLPSSACNIQAR